MRTLYASVAGVALVSGATAWAIARPASPSDSPRRSEPGYVVRAFEPARVTRRRAVFDVSGLASKRVRAARLCRASCRATSPTRVLDAALTGSELRVHVPPSLRSGKPRLKLVAEASGRPPLWSDDTETGALSRWYRPLHGAGTSGGEFNSAGGVSSASRARAHSGSWSARLVLPAGSGGVRLFRWAEFRTHRDLDTSVWLYFPRRESVLKSPVAWWNVMQFMSTPPGGKASPIWHLDVQNDARGRMHLDLVWWQRELEGPHAGEAGYRRYAQTRVRVPVGRWFNVRTRLRQSNAFDGALTVWQDDRRLFDLHDVRTSFENCTYASWCADNSWSVNNYSAGLAPAPAVIYADDARVDAHRDRTGSVSARPRRAG